MEFPDLGKHCSENTCRRLDFLPLKCNACEQVFCKAHIVYSQHKCTSAYKKDVQVPVCPLCSSPIPVRKGEEADVAVGEHIDQKCNSSPSRNKQKIFTNKCLKSGCRKKELMKMVCNECQGNFCIKHRHPLDHECSGSRHLLSKAGSVLWLQKIYEASCTDFLKNELTEEAALQRALELSLEEWMRNCSITQPLGRRSSPLLRQC